ncbi:RDD family protein [Mucilaginibacter celer]|uniref:RDD family protein n=1 Tax=Mucilaginibacter celer TaxID=2305508 RepID=A0A494VPL9_9SPHI|nr:RDD family protein [Mucilaginibacter celer]AYL97426.1 RDD family protein [Mucilaginibacter celer]
MDTIRITTSQNIDIDYEVAGVGERILAHIIDMALFIVIMLAVVLIGPALGSLSKVALIVMIAVYAGLFVFYDLICEISMNGQSVGKKIMKIKVISLNGSRPSVGQYLLRWLFRIVDFTLTSGICGLICVIVSDNKQRVGDMVAGTTLIRTVPRTKMDNIVFTTPEEDSYQPVFPAVAQLADKDIELVSEVINTYIKTRNPVVVYNMAERIKSHIGVTPPEGMNDMLFLQTVIKDYSHIIAQAESL